MSADLECRPSWTQIFNHSPGTQVLGYRFYRRFATVPELTFKTLDTRAGRVAESPESHPSKPKPGLLWARNRRNRASSP